MAVRELVSRKFEGHGEDGQPRYSTTRHGRPAPPESVAEWVEIRVAMLGPSGRLAAGRVAVRLLLADGEAERKAALAAGRDLDEWQRYGVLQVLEVWRRKAQEYAPAAGLAGQLYSAWTARYGSKRPQPVSVR